MKKLHTLVATAALLAVAAGVAYAGIPAANGTITACRDAKGVLKAIDAESGATCATNQQHLTWNQQGPAGPQGTAGEPGPAGEQGPVGLQGPAGVSGLQQTFATSGYSTGSTKLVTAACPAGKKAIGGSLQATGSSVTLLSSAATGSFAAWTVHARAESSTATWQLTVAAICVNA